MAQCSSKCCATCAFWTGIRELEYSKTSVSVDMGSYDTRYGKCMEDGSIKDFGVGSTCQKYQKWPPIKKDIR